MTDQTDTPVDETPVQEEPTLGELIAQAQGVLEAKDPTDPSKDYKRQLLTDQVEQFKQTRFAHKANLSRALAFPDTDPTKAKSIANELAAIASYDITIADTQAQLDALK